VGRDIKAMGRGGRDVMDGGGGGRAAGSNPAVPPGAARSEADFGAVRVTCRPTHDAPESIPGRIDFGDTGSAPPAATIRAARLRCGKLSPLGPAAELIEGDIRLARYLSIMYVRSTHEHNTTNRHDTNEHNQRRYPDTLQHILHRI